MFETLMEKLAEQAPATAAVIIIVILFIRAMEQQRTVFNAMMVERDRLFDAALQRRDELFQVMMHEVTSSLNSLDDNIHDLDSNARHAMNMKPKTKKNNRRRNAHAE